MSWYRRLIYAGAKEWLTSIGVQEDVIAYVLSLPPNQLKLVQKWIGKNQGATIQQVQAYLQSSQQPQQPKINNIIQSWAIKLHMQPGQLQTWLDNTDPTQTYHNWILPKINRNFRLEDAPRVKQTLENFTRLKDKLTVKDITQYPTLQSIEAAIEPIEGIGSKRGGALQYKPLSLPGVSLSAKTQDGYEIYEINDPKSLEKMGLGTKWCTREDYGKGPDSSMAADYINQYAKIYIVVQNGKAVMQFTPDGSQFMDREDNPIDVPESIGSLPQFSGIKPAREIYQLAQYPKYAPKHILSVFQKNEQVINIIPQSKLLVFSSLSPEISNFILTKSKDNELKQAIAIRNIPTKIKLNVNYFVDNPDTNQIEAFYELLIPKYIFLLYEKHLLNIFPNLNIYTNILISEDRRIERNRSQEYVWGYPYGNTAQNYNVTADQFIKAKQQIIDMEKKHSIAASVNWYKRKKFSKKTIV